MWSKTTNELGVNDADDEHEDQEGTNPGGKTIKEDCEGITSKPNWRGEAYQAWYGEKWKANNQ